LAIQERENDLVLATFGRGFYILPNYAPLRNLNNETLAKEASLFPIKDGKMFKTWRPLGGLGSKEKGFQGESFYTSPNPEVGVEFVTWIKSAPSDLKSMRLKKEKQAFKEGKQIDYPTLEEFKAEKNELDSYLIYTIEDEEGNFVRELRAPINSGLSKMLWDMQYPSDGMVSERDANQSKGFSSSGIFVLPGKYQVSLSKSVNGEVSKLAGPEVFQVNELNNRTIPTSDRAELVAFKRKALKLNNAIAALANEVKLLNGKLPFYKAATKALPSDQAADLFKEISKLESNLTALQVVLNGDRDLAALDLDEMLSLRRRASSAIYDIYNSTSNIPGSAKANFEIATKEFNALVKDFEILKSEFNAMDSNLDKAGAPYTPGRM
ncbi:MAG: hypothetical protein JW729_04585, partial [Bacteroidales bacterium]|nr:hypothetical protein [Bacteroidales bacterium]